MLGEQKQDMEGTMVAEKVERETSHEVEVRQMQENAVEASRCLH